MVTPIDVDKFENLLQHSGYDSDESHFLVHGLHHGFSIEYHGSKTIKMKSPNLKFRGVGNKKVLWNKIMKEVRDGRYAGPYVDIPEQYQDNYIQSPIGLVDKDGGKDCRLIFHLSYPRGEGTSVNESTPRKYCTVQYPDFTEAIELCIKEGKSCRIARSDVRSAFRNLGICPEHWKYLIMKAESPVDGKTYYFINKALPFGHSISCALFQTFLNGVAHVVMFYMQKKLVNYLDDYY